MTRWARSLPRIPVPADRLQTGPRSHRFHVVDISAVTGAAEPPVALHDGDPWVYVDEWADSTEVDAAALATDRKFRAQNLFAIASHTLALFEQHLGRPIPWASGYPHLYLVPQARIEPNAFYSPDHNAVFFGWLPAHDGQPAVYSALSFDIVAHEVSHAILDGLRPRYTEPGPPDQLAFHEALADLVAMLSVFDLPGVVEHLLKPTPAGKVSIRGDRAADTIPDDSRRRAALAEVRAAFFMDNPITGLAEQLGATRRTTDGRPPQDGYPALRRSVKLPADHTWKNDPAFTEPHRRAEVLVAAFMHTLVRMWAERIDPLGIAGGGLDVERVAEEGTKAAQHLLGMLLRALDYLPPVEVEFRRHPRRSHHR